MAGIKINVKIKPAALTTLAQAQSIAISQTAERMLTETIKEQVIPFDEGTLQNDSTKIDKTNASKGVIKIVHDIIYAARLYFNPQFNFNKSKNVNARGEWWEDWLSGSKAKKPAEMFKRYYKKAAARYIK